MSNTYLGNIIPTCPIPLRLALQDLENTLGRNINLNWYITRCHDRECYALTVNGKSKCIAKDVIDIWSQPDFYNMLYDLIRENQETWDENLYPSEIAQAFHDAAADWAYIV